MSHNKFRNFFVANTVDQFPKALHTHNDRNPSAWDIPQNNPTDTHKIKETICRICCLHPNNICIIKVN